MSLDETNRVYPVGDRKHNPQIQSGTGVPLPDRRNLRN
jgi:hypothetical protein